MLIHQYFVPLWSNNNNIVTFYCFLLLQYVTYDITNVIVIWCKLKIYLILDNCAVQTRLWIVTSTLINWALLFISYTLIIYLPLESILSLWLSDQFHSLMLVQICWKIFENMWHYEALCVWMLNITAYYKIFQHNIHFMFSIFEIMQHLFILPLTYSILFRIVFDIMFNAFRILCQT